jgi:hypothetical protein
MNNLVFNTLASQLYTTITNATLTVSGDVTIAGTASVTITNSSITVGGAVLVTNPTMTVAGDVTIAGTASVTITNATVTVGGSILVTNPTMTVAGDVTIAGTASVTITNATVTVGGGVNITGHTITSLNTTLSGVTGTNVIFGDTDISQITTGSIFVYNGGATPFTVSVQISPTTTDGDYIDDPDNTEIAIGPNAKYLIALSKYGNYTRLQYSAASAATFSAYYNGQM